MIEQLPINLNLQVVQGDDLSYPVLLGMPTSGYAFNAAASVNSVAVPFDVSNYDTINGGIAIGMSHTVTSGLSAGVYDWQLAYTTNANFVQTYYQGLFTVLEKIGG